MFQSRFAAAVERREKRQTIRPLGKPHYRPPHAGDELSLRTWSGKAYRSPQRKLREPVTCTAVRPVFIGLYRDRLNIRINDQVVPDADAFARADGFTCVLEMREWFEATHGLPFVGRLIEW